MPKGIVLLEYSSHLRRPAAVIILAMELRRSGPELGGGDPAVYPQNKLEVRECFLALVLCVAVGAFLGRHGGGRDKLENSDACSRAGWCDTRCMFLRCATSAAQVWPPNLIAEGRLSWMQSSHPLFNLQDWRSFNGVTVADPVFYIPSGLVPGEVEDGRLWLQFHGDGRVGLDCFSYMLSRVCVVKKKDYSAFSWSPSVICNHTFVIECTD